MNERVSAIRSRKAKHWGVALAIALAGSAVATSGVQAAPSAGSTAPKSGGTITVAIDGTVSGHCFPQALAGGALGTSRSMFEQLFERTRTGKFVGYLAQKATPSADFKTWTITLRPNIKFSNGEAFDAKAVKLNLDYGRGVGPTAYLGTGVAVNANITAVDVVDDLNVKLTLNKSDAELPALLYRAGRYVMRAPAQVLNTATCATNPIGTGPFMMQSYNQDQLVVVRNPNYWRKDGKGRQLPYLDGITFINVKEASQRAAAVRTKSVDVAFFTQGDATFTNDLSRRKSVVTGYKSTPTAWGQWVPNVGKKGSPFKFKNCRLAAAHSIDWNAYNKVRLKGTGEYSGSIVGKSNPMYTLKGSPKFDLVKAREYLTACNTDLGAAGPMKITLYADTSTQSINNVKFIQAQMEKAGIQFNEIFIAEASPLIGKIYAAGGNAFDFAEGTPAEGASPAYVIPFMVSKAFPADTTSPLPAAFGAALTARFNIILALGNHGDTKVDDLIYAAQAETNAKLAKTKWQAATEYIQTEGLAIPAVHGAFRVFTNNKSKLGGVGTLKMPSGDLADIVETKGLEYTGIWKK